MNLDAARAEMNEASMVSPAPHPTRDFRMMALVAVVVVLVINSAFVGLGYWLRAQQPTVEMSEPEIESHTTALCPGNTLEYSFRLAVSSPAHVELKTSEQRLLQGERISFARLQEFTFTEPTTLEVGRKWIVPPFYRQPVTGQEVLWQPGKYEQITVANVVGRSEIAEIKVDFSIRPDCP